MSSALGVPAGILALLFLVGGAYAFHVRRSLASLLAGSIISAAYAATVYVIFIRPNDYLGFCLGCTVSAVVLGLGIWRLARRCELNDAQKRSVGHGITAAGVAGTCYYLGVLLGKRFGVEHNILYVNLQ